jgi:hypothetical protein
MSKLATVRGTEFLDIGTCVHNSPTVRTMLDRTYSVYYDAPAARCGVVNMFDFSEKLQLLCLKGDSSDHHRLSFVFEVKIAGIAGRCLWDSGAIRNFVSLDFVKRNALHVYPENAQIALADGSLKASSGFIKIKVRIQEYTETVRFTVTDLVPGFDSILGDSWNKHQGVPVDYGVYNQYSHHQAKPLVVAG